MKDTITFSDSKSTNKSVLSTSASTSTSAEDAKPSTPGPTASFEEYCKRYPNSLECREYDV